MLCKSVAVQGLQRFVRKKLKLSEYCGTVVLFHELVPDNCRLLQGFARATVQRMRFLRDHAALCLQKQARRWVCRVVRRRTLAALLIQRRARQHFGWTGFCGLVHFSHFISKGTQWASVSVSDHIVEVGPALNCHICCSFRCCRWSVWISRIKLNVSCVLLVCFNFLC